MLTLFIYLTLKINKQEGKLTPSTSNWEKVPRAYKLSKDAPGRGFNDLDHKNPTDRDNKQNDKNKKENIPTRDKQSPGIKQDGKVPKGRDEKKLPTKKGAGVMKIQHTKVTSKVNKHAACLL